MKYLSKEQSEEVLKKLLVKFNKDPKYYLDRFFNGVEIKFLGFKIAKNYPAPYFRDAELKDEKDFIDAYECYTIFPYNQDKVIHLKKENQYIRKSYLDFFEYLKEKNIKTLYAIFDGFCDPSKNYKPKFERKQRVLEFNIDESLQVADYFDLYNTMNVSIFPKNSEWLLWIDFANHEFLAGSNDFIYQFVTKFPNYEKHSKTIPNWHGCCTECK